MTIELPKGIEAYFDADRDGDPHAVAAAFTETGLVKDKGRTHRGREAIHRWMAQEGGQYSYTVDPFAITPGHGTTEVTAHVSGSFPGSPIDLRFVFVLAGGKIAELEITV